ncbi:MAG: dihydrodipicolinate synthase family protein [Limnochordia bacterium]|nr:dihydrodipicolinate synthase family protein [Bacillota bacterium]
MAVCLKGVFPPIATPFENGEISESKLAFNMERWNKTDLQGYVVLGSNGEFPYLDEDEKVNLIGLVRKHMAVDKVLIAGTGMESTRATIRMTKKAAEAGADAAIIVNPHYYTGRMTSEVLIRHYTEVADASPIPVMIYNVPGFTGVNIAPDTVAILAAHDNIIGMKDTSGNIVQLAQLVRLTAGKGFDVLAGSANHFLPALAVGAQGGILALANIAPDECVQIQRLFQEAKMEEARELHLRMLPVNQAITAQMGVPGLKAAMEMRGYFGGEPRQPLLPLSDSARETLRQILQEAGLL